VLSFEARPDPLRAENYAPINIWRNLVSLSAQSTHYKARVPIHRRLVAI